MAADNGDLGRVRRGVLKPNTRTVPWHIIVHRGPTMKLLAIIAIASAIACAPFASGQSSTNPQGNSLPPVAPAQGLISQKAMSLSMAKAIAEGALAACQ